MRRYVLPIVVALIILGYLSRHASVGLIGLVGVLLLGGIALTAYRVGRAKPSPDAPAGAQTRKMDPLLIVAGLFAILVVASLAMKMSAHANTVGVGQFVPIALLVAVGMAAFFVRRHAFVSAVFQAVVVITVSLIALHTWRNDPDPGVQALTNRLLLFGSLWITLFAYWFVAVLANTKAHYLFFYAIHLVLLAVLITIVGLGVQQDPMAGPARYDGEVVTVKAAQTSSQALILDGYKYAMIQHRHPWSNEWVTVGLRRDDVVHIALTDTNVIAARRMRIMLDKTRKFEEPFAHGANEAAFRVTVDTTAVFIGFPVYEKGAYTYHMTIYRKRG